MRQERLGDLNVHIVGEASAAPVVVMLHGFGAPGTDLVAIADEVGVDGACWVFPEAPLQLPPEFGVGRAWWMIDIMRLQMAALSGELRDLRNEEPEGLASAREQLTTMLAELQKLLGFQRRQLVLGGFSQGAMLSCDTVLRSDEELAGLVLMSGTFLCADQWLPLMPKRAGLKVLQSHGVDDPLLPFGLAVELRDALRDAGLDVAWHEFAGGHGIAPNVIDGLPAVDDPAVWTGGKLG